MFKKGTIVLVPFPFTDLSGSKVRPAVIISKGKLGDDIIVVFITSKTKKAPRYTINLSPSATNGLKVPSHVHTSKIATLQSSIVLGELGSLSKSDLAKLDSQLRVLLSLS